jgi:hypothetical protein
MPIVNLDKLNEPLAAPAPAQRGRIVFPEDWNQPSTREEPGFWTKAKAYGVGIGAPLVVGAATAPLGPLVSVPAAGLAAGAGDIYMQKTLEPEKPVSYGRAGIQTLAGMVPGVRMAQTIRAPIRAGIRAAEGAGINVLAEATEQKLVRGEPLDLDRLASAAKWGAAFGGTIGLGEAAVVYRGRIKNIEKIKKAEAEVAKQMELEEGQMDVAVGNLERDIQRQPQPPPVPGSVVVDDLPEGGIAIDDLPTIGERKKPSAPPPPEPPKPPEVPVAPPPVPEAPAGVPPRPPERPVEAPPAEIQPPVAPEPAEAPSGPVAAPERLMTDRKGWVPGHGPGQNRRDGGFLGDFHLPDGKVANLHKVGDNQWQVVEPKPYGRGESIAESPILTRNDFEEFDSYAVSASQRVRQWRLSEQGKRRFGYATAPEQVAPAPEAPVAPPKLTEEAPAKVPPESKVKTIKKTGEWDDRMFQPPIEGEVGNKTVVYDPSDPSKKYGVRFRWVDANKLGVDHGEVQPRTLLTSAARESKLRKMLAEPELERHFTGQQDFDTGFSLAGPDGVIESGNTREIWLRRLKEQKPDVYAEFMDMQLRRAPEFGLSPEGGQAIAEAGGEPRIIRERTERVRNRREFADIANTPKSSQMSPTEVSYEDARRLREAGAPDVHVSASETIEAALLAPKNNKLVQTFLFSLPENVRNSLMDEKGRQINSVGVARLKAALVADVFDTEKGMAILKSVTESGDNDIRTIASAVYGALGKLRRVKSLVREGARGPNLDPTNDIATVVERAFGIRASGNSIKTHMANLNLFSDDLTPVQRRLLAFFGDNVSSGKRIRAGIESIADQIEKTPDPGQTVDVDGTVHEIPSLEQVVMRTLTPEAVDFAESPTGELFGPKPKKPKKKGEPELSASIPRSETSRPLEDLPPYQPGMPAEQIVRQQDIVDELADAVDVPVRVGHFPHLLGQRVRGLFSWPTGVARTRRANDVPTIAHEVVGHAMEHRLGFTESHVAPFLDELLPIATPSLTPGREWAEGMAEFARLYITAPAEARAQAPRFFDFFRDEVRKFDPRILDVFERAQLAWAKWNEMSPGEKVKSRMARPASSRKWFTAGGMYAGALDDLEMMREYTDEAAKLSGLKGEEELNYLDNPYKLSRMFRSWVTLAQNWINDHPRMFHTREVVMDVPGLRNILGKIEGRKDDFNAYLMAGRAIELWGRKYRLPGGKEVQIDPGIPFDEATAAFKQYDSPVFQEAARDLRRYQDYLLQYLVDAGIVGRDNAARMRKANLMYVPFYRIIEHQTRKNAMAGTGTTWANLFDPTEKRIRGSGRPIIPPTESIIRNTYAFINLAERFRVQEAMVRLAEGAEWGGRIAERLPTPLKPVVAKGGEFLEQTIKQVQDIRGFERRDAIDAVADLMGIEKTGPRYDELLARLLDSGDITLTKKGTVHKKDERRLISEAEMATFVELLELLPKDLVMAFRPSRYIPKDAPIVMHFRNGERVLYELPQPLYEAVLNLDRDSLGILGQVFSIPAKMLRVGATRTLEFPLLNMFRDQITAALQSQHGYVPYASLVPTVFKLLKPGNRLYQDYLDSGAAMSAAVSMDRKVIQTMHDELVNNPTGSFAKRFATHPIELLRAFSEMTETLTRLSEFRLARGAAEKAGHQGLEALMRGGFAGREITTDFQRIGLHLKGWAQLTAFFNARLQGMDRAFRAMKGDPKGYALKMMMYSVAPSVLFWAANHDDPVYRNLPEWQRRLFWIITRGPDKEPIRIPKGFDIPVLVSGAMEHVLDWMWDHDRDHVKKFLNTVYSQVGLLEAPTSLGPLLENYANWSRFRDRPLVSRGKEDLSPPLQTSDYTSQFAQLVGQATNYSPAKVDNLIMGWTGGLGRLGLDIVDKALDSTGMVDLPPRAAKTLADYPVSRAFFARFPTTQAEEVSDFWKLYNQAATAKGDLDYYRKNDPEKVGPHTEKNAKLLMSSKAILDTANKIRNIQKYMQRIDETKDMSPEQKKSVKDLVISQMIDEAAFLNAWFYANKPPQSLAALVGQSQRKGQASGTSSGVNQITAPNPPSAPTRKAAINQ